MSLFEDVLTSLVGVSGSASTEHPCQNCPSDCALAPDSCSACKPYKEKLIDAIYKVEHIDEIRSRYVVKDVAEVTSITCKYCGATTTGGSVCDYCGSALEGGSDKIVVSSVKDIPNPILEAQDIIFARYAAVKGGNNSSTSDDFLSQIFSLLGEQSTEDVLGAKMTEDEIKSVASEYGVSVSEYLSGLDNGRYLTMQGKKAAQEARASYSDPMQGIPSNANIPGLAGMGVGTVLGTLIGSASSSNSSSNNETSIWDSLFGGSSSSSSNNEYRRPGGMGGPGHPGMGGGMNHGGPGMGGMGGSGRSGMGGGMGPGGPGMGGGRGGHGGPGMGGGRGGRR